MKKNDKYALQQSPFYKLSSKKRLMDLLGLENNEFERPFFIKYKVYQTKSGRWVQEPYDRLKRLQKRIQRLLSRIKTPSFLYSGKKGVSYVDNARHHLKSRYLLSTDISSFYQSCRKEFVNKFFVFELKISWELADFLSNIVTYDNYIPTGSPSSQIIAYFAYSRTFNRIYNHSKHHGVEFSIYVDDLNFSSFYLNWSFLAGVKYELQKVNLKLKRSKTRMYSPLQSKRITGCIITPQQTLLVPNNLRKKILFPIINESSPALGTMSSALGRIAAARQIEPNIFSGIGTRLNFLKKNMKVE